jgi:hypothetical protein
LAGVDRTHYGTYLNKVICKCYSDGLNRDPAFCHCTPNHLPSKMNHITRKPKGYHRTAPQVLLKRSRNH